MPAPLSPALTNPDMILPSNSTAISGSPSQYQPMLLQSTTSLWSPIGAQTKRSSVLGIQTLPGRKFSGKPPRPLMAGPWQRRQDLQESVPMDSPLEYSPTGMREFRAKKPVFKSMSLDSGTTPPNNAPVGTPNSRMQPEAAPPAAMDSPLSLQEKGINGVRGEELSEWGLDSPTIPHYHGHDIGMGLVRSMLDEDDSDPRSHAALSIRAEEIIANAKERLTVWKQFDMLVKTDFEYRLLKGTSLVPGQ